MDGLQYVEKSRHGLSVVLLIITSAALQRPGGKEAQENDGDGTSKLHDHKCGKLQGVKSRGCSAVKASSLLSPKKWQDVPGSSHDKPRK